MEFTYKSRAEYEDRVFNEWKKQTDSKRKKLSAELKAIDDKLISANGNSIISELKPLWHAYKESKGKKKLFFNKNTECSLSDFMKTKLKDLVKIYVPEEYSDEYYSIIDEFVNYQYTSGMGRRTHRTADLDMHYNHAVSLLYTYMAFGTYKASVADYLRNDLEEEAKDFKYNRGYYAGKLSVLNMSDVIAASINAGNKATFDAIYDAFTSENNNVTVTPDMIRGVVKSNNSELHELLAKFLVAARLEEGLRQAICENADCGTADAFKKIFAVIVSENLIRFAAVKRAIATWTGICNLDNIDRITDKMVVLINDTLNDTQLAKELTKTDDSVKIMIGLWVLAFYEIHEAIEVIRDIINNGSRVQLLTVSYFNRAVQGDIVSEASFKAITTYSDDLEIWAAFMPTYYDYCDTFARNCVVVEKGTSLYSNPKAKCEYKQYDYSEIFESVEEARLHYDLLKKAREMMTKKSMEFSPLVFPWYGVTLEKGMFTQRMAIIAYLLQDQDLIDEVSPLLTEIDGTYTDRRYYVRILLHEPKNKTQRRLLLSYVADKESMTRETAYVLVDNLQLNDEDISYLEGCLKYKNESIRKNVIALIKKQPYDSLKKSVERLISNSKDIVRLAGLDIAKTLINEDAGCKEEISAIVKEKVDVEKLTTQETVLYDEIIKDGGSSDILLKDGYGLYDPASEVHFPEMAFDISVVRNYFSVPEKELDKYLKDLDDFVVANGNLEYVGATGDTRLLANGLFVTTYNRSLPIEDTYPFKEMWKKYYDEHIHDERILMNLLYATQKCENEKTIKEIDRFLKVEKEVLPYCGSSYSTEGLRSGFTSYNSGSMLSTIILIMVSMTKAAIPYDVARNATLYAASLSDEDKWYMEADRPLFRGIAKGKLHIPFSNTKLMSLLISGVVKKIGSDVKDEAIEAFNILAKLDESYQYEKHDMTQYYYSDSQNNWLSVYDYIKAYEYGIVSEDMVYKYIFEGLNLTCSIGQMALFETKKLTVYQMRTLSKYVAVDLEAKTIDRESEFFKLGKKFYKKAIDLILNVELKRGDSETIFSKASKKISCIYGIPRLMEILTALGNDTLDRSTYYYFNQGTGKKECLSHLLQVCYPDENDNAEYLAKMVKQWKVKEDRLIETAMYAPQWLDIVEDYLKCDGFKSGCYYFMAHMNEKFDDKKAAMIAKYTPLSEEELNAGCFDVAWFYEAYEKLGEKMFAKLYKSAKYISDGNKHARARKYADAALDKVTREDLEAQISDKRNKDLLMSYGIIPVKDKADLLHRYEFLQKFYKESRQFGAQRKASEAAAVDSAMKNLASISGYSDSLRLSLAMETELVESNLRFFDGILVDEYTLKISVDQLGKAVLILNKGEKTIKTVPAAIKKNEDYLEIKEFFDKLKKQYSRCVSMFEKSMEESDIYTYGELKGLCRNPVTRSILTNLVYVIEENESGAASNAASEKSPLVAALGFDDGDKDSVGIISEDTRLRIAHPIDLFKSGKWNEMQTIFFDRAKSEGRKQPFKQVFRELYVKLDEELESDSSRMFAGNQIQPKKTVATLKSRRWVADYENGLQKIYYKDNIIATIYAMADWFSPGDVEEPTLEYVEFYDRKTFKSIKIKDIPDIIYSEVMRDTDLAVSVAHAGGVDPVTSHSTIEMRRVIAEFNVKLFKLSNVTFEGTHAFIKGTHGEYTVHLGSGVIHKKGSHMINVLPVHSEKRGKIFLPFIDEDPKSAEIMSKILFFAEDDKIKDPYIMDQILRG